MTVEAIRKEVDLSIETIKLARHERKAIHLLMGKLGIYVYFVCFYLVAQSKAL